MSETALYRKYRPQDFSEVVGQDDVVRVLQGSIKQGKIAHAYLFSGTRGTGKTSLARIFAREIGTSQNDLYEIDAASNRGIDDVRALREAVNTLPFESKRKVYIIDEVHMLTKEAFNALLKTLEEPPAHVLFILATTDPDKLPETVVSRCQVFSFRTPTRHTLRDVVVNVAKKEGCKIDAAGAELIALLGDGSFRDTLGILQKVMGMSAEKDIRADEVEMVTGAPRNSLVNDFVNAVSSKSADKALSTVRTAADKNVDMKLFLRLVLQKLRFALLLRISPGMENYVKQDVSEEDFTWLKTLAAEKSSAINSATLLEFLNAYELAGKSFVPELPVELALAKLFRETTEQK